MHLLPSFSLSLYAEMEMSLAGIRAYPTERGTFSLDLITLAGTSLYIYVYQLAFPVFLGASHLHTLIVCRAVCAFSLTRDVLLCGVLICI